METLKHRPILLLGAGSGLGFTMAQRFAVEGFNVIAGTRSEDKFRELSSSIKQAGGVEPIPFIADITKPNEVITAYRSLGLSPNDRLHYMPVAAGGMESIGRSFMEALVTLKKASKGSGVTKEFAQQVTEQMKALTTNPNAIAAAMEINHDAPLRVFDILNNDGRLDEDSVILNTSSSLSDGFPGEEDLEHPRNYQGPWFYYTIAASKRAGVLAMRESALRIGASHVDIVAAEIADTGVGKLIDRLVDTVQAVEGVGEIKIPKIYRADLADAILDHLNSASAAKLRTRTVYIEDRNTVGYHRPTEWDKPLVPYL